MSKATALAWEKWRVGHPNWKPNPNARRPKYRMTQRESVDKVAFACEVPTDGQPLEIKFPLADLRPPQPEVTLPREDVPAVETADVTSPDLIPPLTPNGPPVADVSFPPSQFIYPPFFPPIFGGSPFPPVTRPYVPPVVVPVTPVTGTTTSTTPNAPVIPVVPAPVPEPSSLVLLAMGMGSTGVMALRGRRARASA